MILVMRNQTNEFIPGHDYTAVMLDADLVKAIARRATTCGPMRVTDSSLAELRFWDASPQCVGSPDPEAMEAIEDSLAQGDGWAILDDDALGSFEEAKADCAHMVIVVADAPAVAWSYRVGSEPIRTVDMQLAGLAVRLGSPLGDPLALVV